MRTRSMFALLVILCLVAACGSSADDAADGDGGDEPPTTEPVPTVSATEAPSAGADPTVAPEPTLTPAPTTTPALTTAPAPTSSPPPAPTAAPSDPTPTPTAPPLGAGPYPISDLAIAYEHPDQTYDYGIGCQGDTSTSDGDAEAAGVDSNVACAALAEPALAERLVDGAPSDRICTEIFGGPDVATVSGTIDGRTVNTRFDRRNGCAIDEWDDLAAPILPPALGATSPEIDPTPALSQRCSNPDGFSISYPQGWEVNNGSVTQPCAQFNPTPFEVPDATDERVAAIAAYVDNVAYSDVAGGNSTIDGTTASTTIDGHQALRRSGEYDGSGLYPAGTPVTMYLVDLALGVDGGPGTLFVTVVGTDDFDHDALVPVLDAMASTIEIDLTTTDAALVARYEGGGAPFSVTARLGSGPNDVCLAVVDRQAQGCVDVTEGPAQPGIRVILLRDASVTTLAGTTHDEVFVVEARNDEGSRLFSYLPVPVAGLDGVKAWALPLATDDVAELTLRDQAGNIIGTTPLPRPDEPAP